MMDLDAVMRRLELEKLYTSYAHCLDNDALEDWPGFFTDDCFYRITSAENFAAGLPIGIIYATSKAMLVDRVMALRKANIYEPQVYRHLVSSMKICSDDDSENRGTLAVTANFLVVRTMQDGAMTLFAVGRYVDLVLHQDDGWKFARKEAVLDSRRIDTLLAIPL